MEKDQVDDVVVVRFSCGCTRTVTQEELQRFYAHLEIRPSGLRQQNQPCPSCQRVLDRIVKTLDDIRHDLTNGRFRRVNLEETLRSRSMLREVEEVLIEISENENAIKSLERSEEHVENQLAQANERFFRFSEGRTS